MIAALCFSVALYFTAVFFNQIWLSVKEKKPVKLTAQAIVTSLCWGVFYYFA